MVDLMSSCAEKAEAMESARQEWQRAKRATANKLSIRSHKAILCLATELGVSLGTLGAGAAYKEAETIAERVAILSGVGAGAMGLYGMLLGVDETDSDYWNAVDDEGVAFGNYLVARLHWCQCRRGKDS